MWGSPWSKLLHLFIFTSMAANSNSSPSLARSVGSENETETRNKYTEEDNILITILHVNDIHSHFEEVNVNTGVCKQKGECYGGVSRLASLISSVREADPDALVLNAGDYYQGTVWYSLYKYKPVVEFSNILNYTAMALGNHDWDDGSDGLQPFLDQVNFPVLAANVRSSVVNGIQKSTIVKIGGESIGIVGYVTAETPSLSNPGVEVEFLDEIASVREESLALKKRGVKIVIALGHAGYDLDMELARSVESVDLVVGGHSHTFLYTGEPPSIEKPRGPYPTYVKQKNGKIVPVVQAYCYTKYTGLIIAEFSRSGKIQLPLPYAEPILMDSSIPKLNWVEKMLDPWREKLQPYTSVVGFTIHDLLTANNAESNIGDVITDSMATAWPGHNIALINDGGIRTQLQKGSITGEDVYNVLPFNNTVDFGLITGAGLKAVLEEGLVGLCPQMTCEPKEFYQMANLRAEYTITSNNTGERVTRLDILTKDGSLEPVVADRVYSIVTVNFLLKQGKSRLASEVFEGKTGPSDYDAFTEYLKKNSPIHQKAEGRIKIIYIRD